MQLTVADASVLIALAKIGKLETLRQVFGRAAMGPAVRAEVLERGKEISAPEVGQVQIALQERWLRVVHLSPEEDQIAHRLMDTTTLGAGEVESISIARSRNFVLIVDDKEARSVAQAMGLDYMGTAAVLLHAFLKGKTSLDELEQSLRSLARVTWLSSDVVAEILRRAGQVRK